MMFHDIGKGFGGGHSEIGARMVRPIARRMRLNADDGAHGGVSRAPPSADDPYRFSPRSGR